MRAARQTLAVEPEDTDALMAEAKASCAEAKASCTEASRRWRDGAGARP